MRVCSIFGICWDRSRARAAALCALFTIGFSAGGCGGGSGQRCNGNSIEEWRGNDFGPGGDWQTIETCSDGYVCIERDVTSHNFENHAFCATPEPDSACKGLSGRVCLNASATISCIGGRRIAYDGTCSSDRPVCYEPEPGAAFCVADTTPDSICAGQPPRNMDFCAVDYAVCRNAEFAQFCRDSQTSITCFDGVIIEESRCTMKGGHCIEVDSIQVSACDYSSP